MTIRPVFMPKLSKPYYTLENYDIDWASGQAAAQKVKNSASLQSAWKKKHPNQKILEVSTKSQSETGKSLSPFHLQRRLSSLQKDFPVETVYHASKVFHKGGPFVDLLGAAPLESKRDPRLVSNGDLVHYSLEGNLYPADPDILFYNWLYINALAEHPKLAAAVAQTDGFTDIEFNPNTGSNCQAKACAIYASLARLKLLDQVKDFESFKKLFLEEDITEIREKSGRKEGASTLEQLKTPAPRRQVFSVGQWIDHPSIGKGEVIRKTPDSYIIRFKVAGPRSIKKDYVERFCKKIT